VVAGACTSIALSFFMGLMAVAVDVSSNSQILRRTNPRLIGLVVALATGAVGAFALAREDVSDTLPGVAIAISLVPPLAVVGISLEAGAPSDAAGALLLFGTNVLAILAARDNGQPLNRIAATVGVHRSTVKRVLDAAEAHRQGHLLTAV